MTRCFQVAGLTIALDLPDGHPVAGHLHNYDPFVIPGPGAEPLLFRLTVVPEAPATPGEVLYRAPQESGEPVVNLLRTEGGFRAEFAPMPKTPVAGILDFSRDFRQGYLYAPGAPATQAFAVNNAMMLLYTFAGAFRSALEMHASVVMHRGRGFLFLGRSGTGKSTHSSLWLKYIEGTELLNDDNPVLRIVDGTLQGEGRPRRRHRPAPPGAAERHLPPRHGPGLRVRPVFLLGLPPLPGSDRRPARDLVRHRPGHPLLPAGLPAGRSGRPTLPDDRRWISASCPTTSSSAR